MVAASLPVAINGGSYWPRGNEMHDESQLEEEEDESSSDSNPVRTNSHGYPPGNCKKRHFCGLSTTLP